MVGFLPVFWALSSVVAQDVASYDEQPSPATILFQFAHFVLGQPQQVQAAYHAELANVSGYDPVLLSFDNWLAGLRSIANGREYAESTVTGNVSNAHHAHDHMDHLVVATVVLVIIFVLGIFGNISLIFVARRFRWMRRPMYMYVVSMAYADLLVTVTAIPEAILTNFLGQQWLPLLGAPACPIFVFLNFFGINAGVAGMFLLTFERYVAICKPLLARKICTPEKTEKTVYYSWLGAALYSCPWLALTTMKPDELVPGQHQCHFRVSREYYVAIFGADLLLFYCIPLATALLVFLKVNGALRKRRRTFSRKHQNAVQSNHLKFQKVDSEASLLDRVPTLQRSAMSGTTVHQSPRQVVRMLMMIVLVFAIMWLPYRGLLLYNVFVAKPWLDQWYMLFAKSLIYLNSAINPILYNVMSARFRQAFSLLLCGRSTDWMDKLKETKV